ncbi:MAG: FG-GAP-like repeat-containing protein [Verrucomicrobiota bacterium]|nr:FG-GAP-like repeat-containing protein [Verrucomicrobiota bacterium]
MKNLLTLILPLIFATHMTAQAGHVEIHSSAPGSASIHLSENPALSAERDTVPTGLTSRALASADFDEDGVPDLVTACAGPGGGGMVLIRRGNVDAIYPNSAEARARRERGELTAAAFLADTKNFSVPETADFIGAGDFDADGHWDIVTARNGGNKLYWLRGDGHGGFAEPKIIYLPGAVTSLGTGEVNRPDGLTDIAVGIVMEEGARLLIYESPQGALRGAPESFPLPAPATALAFGQLDDDQTPDVAIASGSEVITVHGRDRKLSLDEEHRAGVKPAQVSAIKFDAAVLSVVAGDFSGTAGQKLAVLTADGRVRVLERDGREVMAMSVSAGASGSSSPTRLLAAKVSSLPKDDLLVFGRASAVQILTTTKPGLSGAGKNVTSAGAQLNLAASLTADSEVTGVLPMRLNADALQDLVMVTATGVTPSVLETQAAATYVVNIDGVTNDKTPGDGICADANGNCSFNAALQEADAHPGADTITFNIPGGGVHTITHGFGQYANEAVTIDGTTQPGGRIEIVASGDYPIVFYGGNSVLRGVAVYGSGGAVILPTSGNIIEGNYIGFRADGSKPIGFGAYGSGIYFQGGVNGSLHGGNNLIGGTTTQARNVISNCDAAVYLLGDAGGNVIQGNYIGTNVAGTAALPNNLVIRCGYAVTIGGATAGAGNLISGNGGQPAIDINGGSALVQGNLIGTTADGTQPLANGWIGIDVGGNEALTIGGTTAAARNVIAANYIGIRIVHDSGGGALIQGNYIGTNAQATGTLPNTGPGISLSGTRDVTIGGTLPGARNVVSGNGGNGIELVGGVNGTPCRNVVVQGNLIGTDVTGAVALPNGTNGVDLGSADNSRIGGTTVEARNVISGNRENGVRLYASFSNPNRVEGNYIGLDRFGTGALGNRQHGVYFAGQAHAIVGGTAAGAGNVIAFNRGPGIGSLSAPIYGAVLSNSIFSNLGLGIDAGDNGPNRYSGTWGEAPVITAISTSGSQTTISGSLRTYTFGGQKAPYTIQFFSNRSPDFSGYGEGETLVGQTTINAGSTEAVSLALRLHRQFHPDDILARWQWARASPKVQT